MSEDAQQTSGEEEWQPTVHSKSTQCSKSDEEPDYDYPDPHTASKVLGAVAVAAAAVYIYIALGMRRSST